MLYDFFYELALNFRVEQTRFVSAIIYGSPSPAIYNTKVARVFVCYREPMSAMKRRENTFRIDYANVPKKPSSEEVHRFVGETLAMKREDIKRIQYSRNLGIAFIKTTSLEVARKVVEENDNTHEIKVNGKSYVLRLKMEDGAVEVRIYNHSEDVSNQKIDKFLSAYGEVLTIREEVWNEKHFFSGLPTGVRILRMTVKKNIPSYVTIDGETTLLSYYGQQQTCRHCSEFIHNGVSCVQNKKLLVQKLAANSFSYADVAKNTNPPRTKPLAQQSRAAKPSGSKAAEIPKAIPIDTEASTSSTMPAPTVLVQLERFDDFAIPTNVQQEHENENDTWTKVLRKSILQRKTNGNDTDSSTCSRRSTRSTKKMRCDDGDDPQDNDLSLFKHLHQLQYCDHKRKHDHEHHQNQRISNIYPNHGS
ncbi:uncharacterized protein LOC129771168 [Toxorhynchites rutilus septentrionalis]|uniref:uncharacterized protein LOC129771168 n=1 Tax=Toxorhynchites rutilus septentrionalis TaxID=329112 RepID=UPI00247A7386|nr:uncharacterized protein LOC129771168 [Toxorhynchites rutilus septentrionalis]